MKLKVGVSSSLPGIVSEEAGNSQQPPDEEIHKLECSIHGSVALLRGLATVSSRSESGVDGHAENEVAPLVALAVQAGPTLKEILSNSAAQTLSAGLYLFDHISNIVVLIQYYVMSKTGKFSNMVVHVRHFRESSKIPFYVCLGFLACDPAVAAVAFKLRLEPQDHPLRSALFLPIIQFKRFISGIWKTSSWARYVALTISLQCKLSH